MFWTVNDGLFLIEGTRKKFECWGKIEIPPYGIFDASSEFFLVDSNGTEVKKYGLSISTSISDEFHITNIYFIADETLLQAHYCSTPLLHNEIRTEVVIENLKKCSKEDLPLVIACHHVFNGDGS